ncbi:MAG: VanZ family protein [Chloroflexota bacterium]
MFIRRFLLSLPALLITLTIYFFSDIPQGPVRMHFMHQDKILHFIAFFTYGVALQLLFGANIPKINRKKIIIYVILTGTIYGALDEWHQYFVPGRECDALDLLADLIGVSASFAIRNKVDRFRLRFLRAT